MNNSDEKFVSWGTEAGLPVEVLRHLIEFAATADEMQTGIDQMLPPPPIFPVNEIRAMYEKNPMGIAPQRAGFLVIGSCPNGDPVVVDLKEEQGTVCYLSHEQMFDAELRSVAVKVASSIPAFCEALATDASFPLDYWDAS